MVYVLYMHQANLYHTGFKEYLSRLQPLLLWFIEAASYIGEHHLYTHSL